LSKILWTNAGSRDKILQNGTSLQYDSGAAMYQEHPVGKQRLRIGEGLRVGCILLLLLLTGPAKLVRGEDETATKEDSMGELKIEGKHIEQLVFEDGGGFERFSEPGESIRLPTGKYILHEIHLEGGYVCYRHQIPNLERLTVGPDDSPVLKVGAPLKHKVEVKRQGRLLVLSYELLGTGGEKYARQSRDNPPTFALYKGQEKIGDGCFEYG